VRGAIRFAVAATLNVARNAQSYEQKTTTGRACVVAEGKG